MNAFNVNQRAFQIVSDVILFTGRAAQIGDYWPFISDGNYYDSPCEHSAETLICTAEDLQAAINAANIEQEAWVSFGDLSPEEKIDVVNQAIEAGLVEETEDGYYEDIDDGIIILCAEGGGFTVEKREHNQY